MSVPCAEIKGNPTWNSLTVQCLAPDKEHLLSSRNAKMVQMNNMQIQIHAGFVTILKASYRLHFRELFL